MDNNEPTILLDDDQEEKAVVPAGHETRLSKIQDMNSSDIKEKVQAIQQVMNDIMKKDVHYGVIPGCKKPTLLKPGAEVLGVMFRFAPRFVKERIDHANGHREYIVDCELNHITGTFIGSGTGSCSTLESKYKYRNGQRVCPDCGVAAIIKGKEEYGGGWVCFKKKEGCGAKFFDNDQRITEQPVGKIENPDIADNYNTVLKMAKKRAYVDAVLTATGASDIFTQDLEPEHGKQQDTKPKQEKPTYNQGPKGNRMPRLSVEEAKKHILDLIEEDQKRLKILEKDYCDKTIKRVNGRATPTGGWIKFYEDLKTHIEKNTDVF